MKRAVMIQRFCNCASNNYGKPALTQMLSWCMAPEPPPVMPMSNTVYLVDLGAISRLFIVNPLLDTV